MAYKIRGERSLARFFSGSVARWLMEERPGAAVVPVPFRKAKMRKRGWDPVVVIARILEGRGMRWPAAPNGFPERPENPGLRRAPGKPSPEDTDARRPEPPDRLVLLDDVLTTGATLSECARVLKAGGTERVDAVVLAAD